MLKTYAQRLGVAAFVVAVSIGSVAMAGDRDRGSSLRSEHRDHDRDRASDRDRHDRDRDDRHRHDRGHGSWHHDRDDHPRSHGYWTTRSERVLVTPGRWETRYVPAQVQRYYHNGCWHERIICAARYERVWIQPVYQTRYVRQWCDGDRHSSSGFTFRWEF